MDTTAKLMTQIESELKFCDSNLTPNICSNLAKAEDRTCIIQTIAEVSLSQKITISEAIHQTEQLFSENNIN